MTDLDQLAQSRAYYLETYGYLVSLQDAERAVGLTEADIWEKRRPVIMRQGDVPRPKD